MRTSMSEEAEASSREEPGTLRLRIRGALMAASLSAMAAAVSYWLRLYWWDLGFGVPVAPAGVVAGTILGFLYGPRASTTRRPVTLAFKAALAAPFVGMALLWLLGVAASSGQGSTGLAPSWDIALFVVLALPAALALALPVTLPLALLTVAAMRPGKRFPGFGRAALVVATTAASLGFAAIVPRPNLQFDAIELAPVRLEWTVANHGKDPQELGIFAWDVDGGYGGSVATLPPCFITTDRTGIGSDWFLTLEPYGEESAPSEVVSAAYAGASRVQVWVDIWPDGRTTFEFGRGGPTDRELTADLCTQGTYQ
jgi:hypothetical protein